MGKMCKQCVYRSYYEDCGSFFTGKPSKKGGIWGCGYLIHYGVSRSVDEEGNCLTFKPRGRKKALDQHKKVMRDNYNKKRTRKEVTKPEPMPVAEPVKEETTAAAGKEAVMSAYDKLRIQLHHEVYLSFSSIVKERKKA